MVLGLSLFSAPTQAPTIPSGNELHLISGNTLKAKAIPLSVKFQTLGDKFQEMDFGGYITALAVCESGDNQLALNPIDLDGTASCGLFQFKRTTWKNYIKEYNLFGWEKWEEEDFENALWSGDVQRIVVRKMFVDPEVDLWWEFPDCSKSLNLEKNYGF